MPSGCLKGEREEEAGGAQSMCWGGNLRKERERRTTQGMNKSMTVSMAE